MGTVYSNIVESTSTHDVSGCNSEHDVSGCNQTHRLIKTIHIYNGVKMKDLYNDFLHILSHHSNDQQFEWIKNQLKHCNINKCKTFKKRYTNNEHLHDSYQQIVNKIHCYFYHSYDIGDRFTTAEKQRMAIGDDEKQYDCGDQLLFNKSLQTMNRILQSKQKLVLQQCNRKKQNKYTALFSQENLYKYGIKFKYGYKEEPVDCNDKGYTGHQVSPKYSSLKEEMISNSISTLTLAQFINEYEKAKIHFDSHYCKSNHKEIKCQYLLSVMIYCNYDLLQYEFSKTYRENDGGSHNEFYFLGKNLKICIKNCGTYISDGTVNEFYHGINEQLSFPSYIGSGVFNGISVLCPLSTSSSLAVAANFTNNNGILVTFVAKRRSVLKYFAVSWLSNFPSESEYLFIQNNHHCRLEIKNIINVKFGFEFKIILSALRIIRSLTMAIVLDLHHFDAQSSVLDIGNVQSEMKTLVYKIICDQLSKAISFYHSFASLNHHAKQLIQVYCTNQWTLHFKENFMQNYKDSKFVHLFFDIHNKYGYFTRIKWKQIIVLFPNVRRIEFSQVALSKIILMDLAMNLKNATKIPSIVFKEIVMFDNIVMLENGAKRVVASTYVQSYQQLFENTSYEIIYSPRNETVTIQIKK
eukprot:540130_1